MKILLQRVFSLIYGNALSTYPQKRTPFSLLHFGAKIYKKILFKYLCNFFKYNNLVTNKQSGFRPGDSTINQLIDFVDEIHQAFDSKQSLEIRSVFLNISKAFDKIWHDGVSFMLKQNRIDGVLLTLLTNYLVKRKQRVVLNGISSEWKEIESGVP